MPSLFLLNNVTSLFPFIQLKFFCAYLFTPSSLTALVTKMYHPLGKNIGEFNESLLNETDKNGCVDLIVGPDLPTKELEFWEFKGH